MKFIDIFSGIGGFRLGMEMAGHECAGHCEIDKFANRSYMAMYKPREDEWYAGDIRTVEPWDLPEADCYCGGFPCQAFSIAGKRGGFDDTRGTLFFEIMRIARVRKPKYLFLENVKGLFSHDGGRTFGTILKALWECGYDAEWQVCNSKDFGVPQNRERVFIIGHLRSGCARQVFPVRGENGNIIKQIANLKEKKNRKNPEAGRVYDARGLSPCITTMSGGGRVPRIVIPVLTPGREEKRQNGRRFKKAGEPMYTLTAQDRRGILVNKNGIKRETDCACTLLAASPSRGFGGRDPITMAQDGAHIRYLTPRECFRLQGFPDEYFDRAREVNSDNQLYKQAGNSVTVNVIYEIANKLKLLEEEG